MRQNSSPVGRILVDKPSNVTLTFSIHLYGVTVINNPLISNQLKKSPESRRWDTLKCRYRSRG